MADRPVVAIANHDPVLIRVLSIVLDDAGYESAALPEGTLAYDEVKKHRPDLIILDTWLESRESGWTLFQVLRLDQTTREIPVLICTADHTEFEKRAASIARHSRVGVLLKPFDPEILVETVGKMLAGIEVSKDGAKPSIGSR